MNFNRFDFLLPEHNSIESDCKYSPLYLKVFICFKMHVEYCTIFSI